MPLAAESPAYTVEAVTQIIGPALESGVLAEYGDELRECIVHVFLQGDIG